MSKIKKNRSTNKGFEKSCFLWSLFCCVFLMVSFFLLYFWLFHWNVSFFSNSLFPGIFHSNFSSFQRPYRAIFPLFIVSSLWFIICCKRVSHFVLGFLGLLLLGCVYSRIFLAICRRSLTSPYHFNIHISCLLISRLPSMYSSFMVLISFLLSLIFHFHKMGMYKMFSRRRASILLFHITLCKA